jgi:hypothetical protein
MVHCCVVFCTNDVAIKQDILNKGKVLHFHGLPDSETMRKEWIVAIRRDEGDCFKVCSVPVGCVLTLSYCLSHTVMRTL